MLRLASLLCMAVGVSSLGCNSECSCLRPRDEVGDAFVLPTCGEPICGVVSPSDAEAAECALIALRDRTPGLIEWRGLYTDLRERSGYTLIRADGSLLTRAWIDYDGEPLPDAAKAGEPQAADIFEACRSRTSTGEKVLCVADALDTEAPV